jgi:hypothetical protein
VSGSGGPVRTCNEVAGFQFGRLVLPRLDALEYDSSDHRVHLGGSIHSTLTTLGIEDLLTERATLAVPRLCHNA